MTNAELIAQLSKLPGDRPVWLVVDDHMFRVVSVDGDCALPIESDDILAEDLSLIDDDNNYLDPIVLLGVD